MENQEWLNGEKTTSLICISFFCPSSFCQFFPQCWNVAEGGGKKLTEK